MGNHNQQGHVHEGEPYPYDLPHNPASQALRDEAAHYMELAGRFTDWLFDHTDHPIDLLAGDPDAIQEATMRERLIADQANTYQSLARQRLASARRDEWRTIYGTEPYEWPHCQQCHKDAAQARHHH